MVQKKTNRGEISLRPNLLANREWSQLQSLCPGMYALQVQVHIHIQVQVQVAVRL